MLETRREKWVAILALSVLSLALSLWGGTPFQQLDSLIERAHVVMENGGNPEFFHYPALVIYLVALPYALLHSFMGDETALELMRASLRSSEPPTFSYFFLGHLVIALFGLLGVLSVHSAALRLFENSRVAFAGGAILATSLLWITDSHFVTVDVPLAALIALTVERTLKVVQSESVASLRSILAIGACAGLATSAKYNGAIVLLPVTLALVLHAKSHGGKRGVALLVPGAVALVIFLATNPFILIEFDSFWTALTFEWEHSGLGHPGYTVENGYSYHFARSLGFGFGWPGVALAAIGFVLIARSRSLPAGSKWLLIGFPLLHFSLIGNSKLAFIRYALPLLPFLALAVSALLAKVGKRRRSLGIVGSALTLLVMAHGLFWGVKHNRLMTTPDIRHDLVAALTEADLDLDEIPVYALSHSGLCARWAGLPFKRKNKIATPKLSDNATRLYIFDSFVNDRLIHDAPNREDARRYLGSENVKLFRDYESMAVIQFSPFNVPRAEVPHSRKSIYSPFLPDLRDRRRAGPFFELYFKRSNDADRFQAACRKLGMPIERTTAEKAWFVNRLRELAETRMGG